jgi:hypothetical protein
VRFPCINCGSKGRIARGPLGGWTIDSTCNCNPNAQVEFSTRREAVEAFTPNKGSRGAAVPARPKSEAPMGHNSHVSGK